MSRWLKLALAFGLVGCGEPPSKEPPALDAASAPVLDGSLVLPEAAPTSEAGRKAAFEGRATAQIPGLLPGPWKGVVAALNGKLTAASAEQRSRSGSGKAYLYYRLELRFFGQDGPVEQAFLTALAPLKLPGVQGEVPKEAILTDDHRVEVVLRHMVAPPGEAREHRAVIEFEQFTKDVRGGAPCRYPPSIALPADAPRWLARPTQPTTTRHRVSIRQETTPQGQLIKILMLFRNGESLGEGMGDLVSAAKQAGFTLTEGGGARQRLTHPSGASVSLRPGPEPTGLGCAVAGPLIEIALEQPST